MKQISWKLVTRLTLALITAVAVFLLIATESIDPSVVNSIISSLVGTFAGAWLAFHRDRVKDRLAQASSQEMALSERDNRHAAAFSRAIFVLASQHNEVIQVVNEISPYKERPDRALMPALTPPGNSKLSQNFDDLMFLLKDHSQILFDLMISQQRFDAAIFAIKSRTALHVDSFQIALERADGIEQLKSEQDVIDAVGVRIYNSLVKATDGVFEHFEGADQILEELQFRLAQVAKKMLPQFSFVRFERIQTEPSAG